MEFQRSFCVVARALRPHRASPISADSTTWFVPLYGVNGFASEYLCICVFAYLWTKNPFCIIVKFCNYSVLGKIS